MKLNNQYCIEADDILIFDPNSGLSNWANTISGSFTYPSGDKPCSIMINKGKDTFSYACHSWLGFPETVLYRYKDGKFAIGKYKSTGEIPNRSEVLWAVGGMGLLDKYNPAEEGFSKFTKDGKTYNYSDVVRTTSHTMIGIKDNKIHLIYINKMSGKQVNYYAKKCGFEMAIMLDGGHISAMNSVDYKVNLNTKQGYGIQGITNETTPVKKKYKVAIDGGHNILNQSNRSPDGSYSEFVHNDEVATYLEDILKRCDIDAKYYDYISANQSVELNSLVALINKGNADVCVSIHTDAFSNPNANGITIFSYKLKGESQELAKAIHNSIIPKLGMNDRGIKDGSHLFVVSKTNMPCVLIECGFHTNPDDLKKLKTIDFRKLEAKSIAKGICNYFKIPYVS
jgi:N-acetylmuramoyl-L-alanine amidase